MKRSLPAIFLICLWAVLICACNKTPSLEQSPIDHTEFGLSIEQAKGWFTSQKEHNQQNITSPVAYHLRYPFPQWEKARLIQQPGKVSYWNIPLGAKEKTQTVLQRYDSAARKYTSTELPAPSLVIYKDSAGTIKALVTQIIPDGKNGAHATDGHPQLFNFSGQARVYSWQGNLQYGYIYRDGFKRQRITPGAKAKPATTGRWEESCIENATCYFGTTCYNPTRPWEGYTYMRLTVDAPGSPICDPPAYDAYPPPHICTDWQYEGQENTQECYWNWIPDEEIDPIVYPDPDPDPDPNIDYGIQDIKNQLTDPCLKSTANMLTSSLLPSQILEKMHRIFDAPNRIDLTYKDKSEFFTDVPNTPWPDSIMARHVTTSNSGGITSVSIYLNNNALAPAALEYVAATILHEIAHAVLTIQYGGTMNFDHNMMTQNYLSEMDSILMNMFGIEEGDARALNIDGLSNTVLGATIRTLFPSYWNSLIDRAHQYLNSSKGTPCL